MFITDYLIPTLIGKKDLYYSDSAESLLVQALTYRSKLQDNFLYDQERLVKRNLGHVINQRITWETELGKFEAARNERIAAITHSTGISEADTQIMKTRAENATVFVVSSDDGKETELDINNIIKNIKLVCVEANQKIMKENDQCSRLHAKYKVRLSNYLRAINTEPKNGEIKLEFELKPMHLASWDYNLPYLRPQEANNDTGGAKKWTRNII